MTSALVQPTGATPRPSAWRPFHHRVYAVIWTATVVANIGTWMYASASAWLMAALNADPLMVSLVQVAASLPVFLFALPAGALADIVDQRRMLILLEVSIALLSGAYAASVSLGLVTPITVLLFTFLIESGGALSAPGWQSIVPRLVPREDLAAAVAVNSVGVNISRAIGPALGGLLTAAAGIGVPLWLNAVSGLATIGGLLWWRPPRRRVGRLPAERFASSIRTGLRYGRNNPDLLATLIRAVTFFLFASAYWALLPLVARDRIGGGPETYGILLGAIGAAAIAGALSLPWLKKKLGADRLVSAGTAGTALALCLYGAAREPYSALAASVVAGASWISVLSTLNVSAQVSLPDWVRGRGLALYITAFFGAMALGSALWGAVARVVGLPWAHFMAAAGALLSIPASWRWKLLTGAGVDLAPSMHWPPVIVRERIEGDAGPVLVTVEYRIRAENRERFLAAIDELAHERRRDGAFTWGVYEDAGEPGRYIENFLVESWLEHLRQHERVTNADRLLQDHIHGLLSEPEKVTHFIDARAAATER